MDLRWEIRPIAGDNADEPPRSKVDLYLRVPFSRMCLFKKVRWEGEEQGRAERR